MYWIYEIWKTFDCLYSGRAAGDICIFTAAHRICERMEQGGQCISDGGRNPYLRGIDLSYWNQNVDWNQVAADDVKFAMLATRFRGAEDPFFSINARGASSVGIDIGAYIYSYATSVEMAEQEADFILNEIKD